MGLVEVHGIKFRMTSLGSSTKTRPAKLTLARLMESILFTLIQVTNDVHSVFGTAARSTGGNG
jgi:hypothetical protein